MTIWKMHEVEVTLASDMHCGDLPLGFVSRTLPFIPAHIPWYALVNPTTRSLGPKADEKTYAKVEELFSQGIRFSPFFICDQDEPLFPFLPHHLDKIEKDYLDSSYGVALDYENRGAMENHLFERECVLAKSRKTGCPTILKGYLFWRQSQCGALCIDHEGKIGAFNLGELLAKTQWGGERNKGWGSLKKVSTKSNELCFAAEVDLGKENPILFFPKNMKIPFFLAWQNQQNHSVHGELRPLTGRRHLEKKGSGLRMDDARIVWNIGWKTNHDVSIELINHRLSTFTV